MPRPRTARKPRTHHRRREPARRTGPHPLRRRPPRGRHRLDRPGHDAAARLRGRRRRHHRPRLLAAGADLHHVHLLHQVHDQPGRRHPRLLSLKNPDDLDRLQHLIEQHQPTPHPVRLLIIDPISGFMGDDDGHNNNAVRSILGPLAKLAEDFQLAVLAITHLNKAGNAHGHGDGANVLYRAMGSLAFTAAARVVHLAVKDPDQEHHPDRRWLIPIKSNLCKLESAVYYDLTPGDAASAFPGVPVLRWHERRVPLSDERVRRVLGKDKAGPDLTTKLGQAKAWLRAYLAERGPTPVTQAQADARAAGITEGTFNDARQQLGCRPKRQGFGPGSQLILHPPGDDTLQAQLFRDASNAR
ncbi:MAG: AAA family ATPase [Planctomycetota bacterium]